MHVTQFSIIKKDRPTELAELKSLGFNVNEQMAPKAILQAMLAASPIDETTLQATPTQTFTEFITSENPLDADNYWTIALQLLGFTANFDFQPTAAQQFAQTTNLAGADQLTFTSGALINHLYTLLSTRGKNGMTLIDSWVADGLIPQDNQYHFFNDKALASFDTTDVIRESIWVETPVDTQNQARPDLVQVQIIRPLADVKLPVVMTASPYHRGINELANDQQLHDMVTELTEKTPHHIELVEQPVIGETTADGLATNSEDTIKFTHNKPLDLNNYLLARGFASIYVGGVGTRGSDGFQTSGDYQQIRSMTAVIDWLNGRARAYTDRSRTTQETALWANGKVAMTGKSYLGTMAYGAATTGVDGLEVILAESGITDWYQYYRENGLVRSPGGFPGEDLDVLAALTYSRDLDGADYVHGHKQYQAQLQEMTTALDRTTGDYNQYWYNRSYLPNANQVKADVLIVHGLQDWNVTPDHAYRFWQALPANVTKHAFLHRGAHVYMNDWQSIDFTETINTYFTAKLLQRPLTLQLPPVIVEANDSYQSYATLHNFGGTKQAVLPVPTSSNVATFANQYEQATFDRYAANFQKFKDDLFTGQLTENSLVIDLPVEKAQQINGPIQLHIRMKINDTKGLLSAQVLDYGEKQRVGDTPSVLDRNVLDRGRNFWLNNLQELPFNKSPYQVISKGFMNLQNRHNLLQVETVNSDEWFDFNCTLQPTIYNLATGDTLRLVLYSTDFEHTVRDNRDVTYSFDLSELKLILPE